ncbi:DUF2019 domain-containing protein [Tardiphaga sp. 538_B7_N1_4]|jgi:hypothetical protein|uniref:DUF2019 domain-containing protein n=1 Tax=unclassified Tardiphaga TaxID=2631404 RepID=UPI000E72ECC4
MTTKDLKSVPTEQLADDFLALAIAKGEAIMGDQTAQANRLYWRIDAVRKELKAREGDQRRFLARFYSHRDPQVRMEAAMATLAIFPEQAREVLQSIRDRKEFPHAGEAGLTLLYLDRGEFKPV